MRLVGSLDECLPGPGQELLLRAALLEGGAAVEAWSAWRRGHASGPLDAPGSLDTASARMLPLVHGSLSRALREAAGPSPAPLDPRLAADLEVLRRVHRGAWGRNQVLFAAARPVLASMQAAGFEPVLVKGASLTLAVYGDAGARPMSDVDVLVRPGQALEAGRILEAHGFAPTFRFDEQRVRTLNGLGFARQAGAGAVAASVDLHWRLVGEPCDEAFDEAVHANAREAVFAGLPVRVLHPTDELLLACLHGIRWNPMPPFRWVADAHLLVTRAGADIDWRRFVDSTLRNGFALPVATALRYAARTLATPVPLEALAALEAAVPTLRERLEMAVRLSPRTGRFFGNVPDYLLRWSRLSEGQPLLRRAAGLPRYLADCWGCREVGDVPRHAAALARRRFAAALRQEAGKP